VIYKVRIARSELAVAC